MSDSKTKEKVDAWSSAQLGQKLDTATPDELQTIRKAGLVPEKVAKVLAMLENNYDPDWGKNRENYDHTEDPRRAENTEKYQEILKLWITVRLTEAVRVGHDRIINRFIRVVEQDTSIEHVDSVLNFARWVTREAGITYLAGHMGAGKTDFGLTMLEIFYKEMSNADRGVKVATNIKSTAEHHDFVDFINTQPDLIDWLESDGSFKLFLFDEASSHASGYAEDSSKVTKQFRSMIRLIRKNDGNMVIIGHDGKDLHPTVRELADFVQKKDKKEAAVFKGVRNREGISKKFDVSKIPQTNLHYDTKEASTWEWATEDGENGKDMGTIRAECYDKLKDADYTQADVADLFGVTQSKISQDYNKWKRNK